VCESCARRCAAYFAAESHVRPYAPTTTATTATSADNHKRAAMGPSFPAVDVLRFAGFCRHSRCRDDTAPASVTLYLFVCFLGHLMIGAGAAETGFRCGASEAACAALDRDVPCVLALCQPRPQGACSVGAGSKRGRFRSCGSSGLRICTYHEDRVCMLSGVACWICEFVFCGVCGDMRRASRYICVCMYRGRHAYL
jgi:hypothetical protein